MKFKNFRPLVLRQVEYFGETISIPEIWWMASALQWCAFGIVVAEVK